MAKQLKKGDKVVVIAGALADRDDKNKFCNIGPIVEIDCKKNRVKVEGVSLGKKKTVKPSMANPQGGLVDRHEWIHASNVMLVSKWEERQKKRETAGA
jgi:large subunit ribosomal protein L24